MNINSKGPSKGVTNNNTSYIWPLGGSVSGDLIAKVTSLVNYSIENADISFFVQKFSLEMS